MRFLPSDVAAEPASETGPLHGGLHRKSQIDNWQSPGNPSCRCTVTDRCTCGTDYAPFLLYQSFRSTVSSLGFNTGYIEELYKQYLDDPQSVSESWRDFFAYYHPDASFMAAPSRPAPAGDGEQAASGPAGPPEEAPAAEQPAPQAKQASPQPPSGDGAPQRPVVSAAPSVDEDHAEVKAIRGPSAKIVENMEDSIGVPTATSIRTMPVKLLIENRALLGTAPPRKNPAIEWRRFAYASGRQLSDALGLTEGGPGGRVRPGQACEEP